MARNRSERLEGRAEMLKYARAIERWLKDESINRCDTWQQIPVPVQNEMDRHCPTEGTARALRTRRLVYIRERYGA